MAAEATDSSAFGWRCCWEACCFYASEINSFLAFSPQSLHPYLHCLWCVLRVSWGRSRDSVMDRRRMFSRTRNNSISPVLVKVKGAPVRWHFGYDEAYLLCSCCSGTVVSPLDPYLWLDTNSKSVSWLTCFPVLVINYANSLNCLFLLWMVWWWWWYSLGMILNAVGRRLDMSKIILLPPRLN